MNSKPLESVVLKQCLEYLKLKGICAWRQNSGSFAGEHKGKKRFVKFSGADGITDLVGVLPNGKFIGIEIKRPGGKPKPHQEEFMRMIIRNNGVAFWVDSVDQLIEKISELGF